MPLIDRELGGNVLLKNRKLAELKDDAKCAYFAKLNKWVKKFFNLTKIGKKKLHCQISHFLARFGEPIR